MPSFTSLSSSSPEGEYYYSAGGATCLSCLPCCQHHHPLNQASSRSMGPFAESMGLSANMAMWLAVVQLPVTMGLALHYPTVRIDVFSTTVRTVTDLSNNNQTLTVVVASPDGSAVEVSCANVSVNLHTHASLLTLLSVYRPQGTSTVWVYRDCTSSTPPLSPSLQ